jgi:two-component system, chemotaxis family, protein-glutamate methylesterase/glutaminase
MNKIRVLIVDDSAIVRQSMESLLNSDKNFQVIGTAADPYYAAEKIKKELPDVITLDIEMPRMDGITFLQKIMSQHPIPVVICSSLSGKGSETALKAIEYGAVDIIEKPKVGTKEFFKESKITICDTIKAAAQVNVKRVIKTQPKKITKKLTADAMLPKATSRAMIQSTEKVIVVGASTGGTEALKTFLEALPANTPGIVIVQHMPENFTRAFADRLNSTCHMTVREAKDNDSVLRGFALIAPGNKHVLMKRSGARYYIEVKDGPLVSRHRPSVDVLFRSASRYAGKNACGVIMTGMGDDGAKGMLELNEAGAYTIAQDEASCVVFGMPKEAINLGGVNQILPLEAIAGSVLKVTNY